MSKLHNHAFVYALSFLFVVALVAIWLSPNSAYAVKRAKASSYANGHQVWFEAEDFDERDAASAKGRGYALAKAEAKLNVPDVVFGDALTDTLGNDTIWLLYNFDIGKIGGKAGEWRFWGRIINPSNQSDWLWVLGHDGKEIPKAKPADFVLPDDRIFEADVPKWAWIGMNGFGDGNEGHIKKLSNGKNTMMIWWRQSETTDLWDVFMWSDNKDYKPTDDDYKNAKDFQDAAVSPQGNLVTTWGNIKSKY